MKLSRRDLLAGAGAAAEASLLPVEVKKPHLITLSFDDGFEKSFTKTAEIHESFGLKACLNIIATKNHG
jgi:hypothetical protein